MEDELIYPVTIIQDRYSGTYSGAAWTAFNLEAEDVPEDTSGSDIPCAYFWDYNTLPVGKGATPDEAFNDLKDQLTR